MEYVGIKKKQGSIVDLLKDEILSGNISGGTEITQNELAASLGVSRMPVREAFILLEYQGLIERLPNSHVRVTEFTEDYFTNVFHLCADMELEVLKDMPDRKRLPDNEMGFHRQICSRIPYSFIRKTLETIIEIYLTFALHCRMHDADEGQETLQQMIEALDSGAVGQAEILFYQYFDALSEAIMKERMS